MPELHPQHGHPPADWHEAFAALPLEQPPADGWSRLATRLPLRRRRSWARPLAIAAALLLAVALPWRLHTLQEPSITDSAGTTAVVSSQPSQSQPEPAPVSAPAATLQQLYAESARLESLLQVARDDRVATGTAAALSGELEARVAAIDATLMQPGLSPERQLWLWRSRVDTLRSLTGFESTRRWLAANGARYDGALARVD